MANEYKCVAVRDQDINNTLNEWSAAGWGLHTATAIQSTWTYHYLYFRREN